MEEDLHLDAAAALALIRGRAVERRGRRLERGRRLTRTMQALEAVALAEQAQVIAGEGLQRAVVPAERACPALLALEEPADLATIERRATRVELRAAQEVLLDLRVVADQGVRARDLEDELDVVPQRSALGVDAAVAREDVLQVTPLAQGANGSQALRNLRVVGSVGSYGSPPITRWPAGRRSPRARRRGASRCGRCSSLGLDAAWTSRSRTARSIAPELEPRPDIRIRRSTLCRPPIEDAVKPRRITIRTGDGGQEPAPPALLQIYTVRTAIDARCCVPAGVSTAPSRLSRIETHTPLVVHILASSPGSRHHSRRG
ncbi:MAG: hypothetical protein AB1689_01430 [Thermodesulfobacteriota bacterium]